MKMNIFHYLMAYTFYKIFSLILTPLFSLAFKNHRFPFQALRSIIVSSGTCKWKTFEELTVLLVILLFILVLLKSRGPATRGGKLVCCGLIKRFHSHLLGATVIGHVIGWASSGCWPECTLYTMVLILRLQDGGCHLKCWAAEQREIVSVLLK